MGVPFVGARILSTDRLDDKALCHGAAVTSTPAHVIHARRPQRSAAGSVWRERSLRMRVATRACEVGRPFRQACAANAWRGSALGQCDGVRRARRRTRPRPGPGPTPARLWPGSRNLGVSGLCGVVAV